MMRTMRGDFSTRLTFDRLKRFIAVLLQQGRVQLDNDANEGQDESVREATERDREERISTTDD